MIRATLRLHAPPSCAWQRSRGGVSAQCGFYIFCVPVGVPSRMITYCWRCSGCWSTWTGQSDTPLTLVNRPDLVVLIVALARDMILALQPMSCRRPAEVLGVSRHSIWRWRMAIISALLPEADCTLAGIVEADETHQHKSRKGPFEYVMHRRPRNLWQPMSGSRRTCASLTWRSTLGGAPREPHSHHINTVNAQIGRVVALRSRSADPR